MACVKESFAHRLCRVPIPHRTSAKVTQPQRSGARLVLRPNLEASRPNLSLNLHLVYICDCSSLSSIMDCRRSYSLSCDAL